MFKKLLAKVGIGAATVDTRLNQDSFVPGDIIDGEVHITGGDIEQEIKKIHLYIAILNRLWRNSLLKKFGKIEYLTINKKLEYLLV